MNDASGSRVPEGASLIGRAVARAEDTRLLTGTGTFVDDLHRPGLLHAAVLRSAVAHGRLVRVDGGPALSLAGVRAVITARDIGEVPTIPIRIGSMADFRRFMQPVIA